jgi:uncharacterized protein with von Willebrand factor type A (vWA) domain
MSAKPKDIIKPEVPFDIENCEYYFLLDRSGSMSGSNIEMAKKALKLFLSSLPFGSYFNIISFGSTFVSMFKSAVEYSDTTLSQAISQVETMKADLGGTEILKPLK